MLSGVEQEWRLKLTQIGAKWVKGMASQATL